MTKIRKTIPSKINVGGQTIKVEFVDKLERQFSVRRMFGYGVLYQDCKQYGEYASVKSVKAQYVLARVHTSYLGRYGRVQVKPK